MARLNYLELPVGDVPRLKQFYGSAFGWQFADFGPTYAATTTGDVDLGLEGDAENGVAKMLPVIEVESLEEARDRVVAAGGTVTVPIFGFPGGRRFHFRDPQGHELGVWTPERD
ncbi:VOC family protein [Stakelama tenebrarum]|uniref:VOC family protein n=1 Tax=Stakelama tenebrarum TaxID=2711215 RepID=A0A6G6Y6K3_9SPHN|nr:VOC family protein [Sphingosinithalassobacter tenebrarum]QIG80348.1 VOC family protein [Sphingosinithalassobacter tenebrarum]